VPYNSPERAEKSYDESASVADLSQDLNRVPSSVKQAYKPLNRNKGKA